MKRIFIVSVFISFLSFISAFSQERYGYTSGFYSGITGITLNPASMVRSPFQWEGNIVGIHQYFDNNYAYLQGGGLIKIGMEGLKANKNGEDYGQNFAVFNSNIIKKSNQDAPYKFLERSHDRRRNYYSNTNIQLPGLMISKKTWSAAVSLNVRSAHSARGVPQNVTSLLWESATAKENQNIKVHIPRTRINGAVWSELCFSYGQVLSQRKKTTIAGAATFKVIRGSAAYFVNNRSSNYVIPNDTNFIFVDFDGAVGYAPHHLGWTKADQSSYASNPRQLFRATGMGFGMDMGIYIEKARTYAQLSNEKKLRNFRCPDFRCQNPKFEYLWRLGISLIDWGYFKNSKNAVRYDIKSENTNIPNIDTNNIERMQDVYDKYIRYFEPQLSSKNSFAMWLPAAISVQFDYNLYKNIYVNSIIVKALPHFNKPGIDRANSIAFVPRWDTRQFGIAMPISFYQYHYPNLGLAIRVFNKFYLGTDKITAFLGSRISGVDIYFGFKINGLKQCPKTNKAKAKKVKMAMKK